MIRTPRHPLLQFVMKTIRRLLWLLIPLLVSSCVPPSYAELATYEAVAPEYLDYIQADPKFGPSVQGGPAALQRRLDQVETWRARVGAPAKVVTP